MPRELPRALEVEIPLLSLERRAAWPRVKREFCQLPTFRKWAKLKPDANVGPEFVKAVNDVLASLGCFYGGKTRFNERGDLVGDAEAFLTFFDDIAAFTAPPKGATAVCL